MMERGQSLKRRRGWLLAGCSLLSAPVQAAGTSTWRGRGDRPVICCFKHGSSCLVVLSAMPINAFIYPGVGDAGYLHPGHACVSFRFYSSGQMSFVASATTGSSVLRRTTSAVSVLAHCQGAYAAVLEVSSVKKWLHNPVPRGRETTRRDWSHIHLRIPPQWTDV